MSLLAYPDSTQAIKLIQSSKELAATNSDSSFLLFEQGLRLFEKNDDLRALIKSCSEVGSAFDIAGIPERALSAINEGKIENLFRSPKTIEERKALGWLYTNEGYIYQYSLGKYDKAKLSFEEAKSIFEQHTGKLTLNVLHFVHYNLGNIYTRLGDHEAARILLERYKKACLEEKDYPKAAMACNDMGLWYVDLGQTEKAVNSYLEGLSFPNPDAVSKGLLQGSLAATYFENEQYQEALRFAKLAIQSCQEVITKGLHPLGMYWQSNNYKLLGGIYSELKEFDHAKDQFERALSLLKSYYPDTIRREFAKLHLSIGEFYEDWDINGKALKHFHIMLHSVLPEFHEQDPLLAPSPKLFYAENAIIEALEGKAKILASMYDESGIKKYLDAAIIHYQLLFEAEKTYRKIHQFETSKLNVLEESRNRSEGAIWTALMLEHHTPDGAGKKMAFDFAEKSKSVLLFEALKHSNARSIANIPDSLLQRESELLKIITQLEKELFNARQGEKKTETLIDSLESILLRFRKENIDLMIEIEDAYPAYHSLKYGEEQDLVLEIQRNLGRKDALIEYFVGGSYLFVFLFKKDLFEIVRIQKDSHLEDWILQFRKNIELFQFEQSQNLCESYSEMAFKLYEQLILPLEAYDLPENLTIIPSGILGLLPFEALLKSPPEQLCQFRNYDYLIYYHNLVYNYSASLWLNQMADAGSNAKKDFIGFAPEFDGNSSSGFGELKFNIPTLHALEEMIGGQIFTHQAASRKNFENHVSAFQMLHFATHAKANAVEGDFSFIVLSKPDGGFDTLYVKDIYNQRLIADLVFLGACETGFGKLHNGEGVISLARSFLYAGARSVLTTFWSVNDEVTKNITTQFYQNLKTGSQKSHAIRNAKMSHLQDLKLHPNYAHPVYWAAYTPIGNMEPIFGVKKWIYAILGFFIVVFLFFFGLKSKSFSKGLA